MSKPTPPTYRTTNWCACSSALKRRGALQVWFDPETVWLAESNGKQGRAATFTDAAIQACLTLKALFGLPLRQFEPWNATGPSNHGEEGWRKAC